MKKIERDSPVSYEDCVQIIKKYAGGDKDAAEIEVTDYETKPFSNEINGFMGDHLLIYITYKTPEKSSTKVSFFAKRFPFDHELQSRYALTLGAFANEIATYDVIFNEYKKCKGFDLENMAPKFMFGRENDILVFEDLSCQGYVIPQNPNALSLDHIQFGLQVLAKYHAGGIAYQEMKSKQLGRKYRLIEDFPEVMQEPLFVADPDHLANGWFRARISGLKAVVDLLPNDEKLGKEKFKKNIDRLGRQAMDILTPNEDYYNVLCHGDMWAKNLLFRYDEEKPVDCRLIDFQLQRYCQPVHDVLQFVYLAINTDGRRQHLHDLLRYYHDRLRIELLKSDFDVDAILDYDSLEASVSYLLPQIKLQTAFYLTFQGANQEFHKKVTSDAELFKMWVFGDGAPFTTELYQTDQRFKKFMIDTFKELKYQILYPAISLEDCFKIAAKILDTTRYSLINYHYEPLKIENEHLDNRYKLKIDVSLDSEKINLTLNAKFYSDSDSSYNQEFLVPAFVKEIFAVKTLFPLFSKNEVNEINQCSVPCYVSRVDDLLVFDDMEFDDYVSPNPKRALSYEELLVVVQKLAIYHASNIVLEEKLSDDEEVYRLGERFANELKVSCERDYRSFDYIIDLFPEVNVLMSKDEFKNRSKRALEDSIALLKPSDEFRNVVCHGDLQPSSLLIQYDNKKPIDCLITDYRSMLYCPPSHDLMSLLYLVTSRTVRLQNKTQLIRHYYQHFSDVMKRHGHDAEKIYTFESFSKSCAQMETQAICKAVNCYPLIMAEGDFIKEYVYNSKISTKDRQDFITDMCSRGPILKDRMKQVLRDLLDLCALKY